MSGRLVLAEDRQGAWRWQYQIARPSCFSCYYCCCCCCLALYWCRGPANFISASNHDWQWRLFCVEVLSCATDFNPDSQLSSRIIGSGQHWWTSRWSVHLPPPIVSSDFSAYFRKQNNALGLLSISPTENNIACNRALFVLAIPRTTPVSPRYVNGLCRPVCTVETD